jgi:hypothetical protein
MMEPVNRFANAVVGGLTGLVHWLPPSVVLMVHALAIAVLAVVVYALVSNQRVIKERKNRMIARLLEIRLFHEDPIAVLGSFRRVLSGIVAYMGASLKPLIFLLPVVLVWIAHLAGWFEWRPLVPGEATLVTLKLKPGVSPVAQPASLEAPAGFAVETPAFRSLATNEISWRIRALQTAGGDLHCDAADLHEHKEVVANTALAKVSPKRTSDGFWSQVLYPWEPPLAKDSPFSEIRIDYPRRSLKFFGFEINWLVALLIGSIALALVVKKPFRVEF